MVEKTDPEWLAQFSASLDGQRVLWTQVDQLDADLVLVENFRRLPL